MRLVLRRLAHQYNESWEDRRATREIATIAQRLIVQHAEEANGCQPSWDLRCAVSTGESSTDHSSCGLYRYFANAILQIQSRSGDVQQSERMYQTLPPWLRSALQGKRSQSSTDADVDSKSRTICVRLHPTLR
tara:strand:+ start:334 stop:732 length:399 start_codon:yes stop_codon:yes gene_type:complete